MLDTERRIGNYALGRFIGYGASSVVFEGYDIQCAQYNVKKEVAIKFIWDQEQALTEVARLEQTQSIFEICDLITYTEITNAEARDLVWESIKILDQTITQDLMDDEERVVGVLVMQLVKGEHLMDRRVFDERDTINHDYEWTLDFEHPDHGEKIVVKEWLTETARDLSETQRLDLMRQLARAVAEAHASGVVHGDLTPWNVFYSRSTGRVSIIDLGRDNFGVQGWRAPDHWKLMNGEIEGLTAETDVWLLGQWMRRLLPNRNRYQSLISRCLAEDPAKRPSADAVVHALLRMGQRRFRIPTLAPVIAALIVLVLIFTQQEPQTFVLDQEGYNRIAVLPFDGSANGPTVAEMVRESLALAPRLTVLRDQDVSAAAREVREPLPDSIYEDGDRLQSLAASLGAQFVLRGVVEESDDGDLLWMGMLVQRDGPIQRLELRGQNSLVLADALASACLKLLGSDFAPLPTSEFYSTDLRANFLYTYGKEFLDDGNINAAEPLFRKAVEADANFHWAKVRLALCLYQSGDFKEGRALLNGVLDEPEVLDNINLRVTANEYLALMSQAEGDLTMAGAYIDQGVKLAEGVNLADQLARMYAMGAWIKESLGDSAGARAMGAKARELLDETEDVIGRINFFIFQYIVAFDQGNLDMARDQLRQALALAKTNSLEGQEAMLLRRQASLDLTYLASSQIPEETLEKLRTARRIHTRLGDAYQVLETDFAIARYYQETEAVQQAFSVGRRVFEQARDRGAAQLFSEASILLSDLAAMQGRDEEAELYLVALLDQPNVPTDGMLSRIYSRLWRIYAVREEFDLAASYLQRDLKLVEAARDRSAIAYTYNNMGELFERQGNYTEAADYYTRSLNLKRQMDDDFGIAWTLRNQVILYIKTDQLNLLDQPLEELLRLDGESIATRLVLARVKYERGEYEAAYQLAAKSRDEALGDGLWTDRRDQFFQLYAGARSERSLRIEPPEQFGNE